MSKRVTINNHDFELVKWLVEFYKSYSAGVKFPAHQNLNELLEKLEAKS